MQGLSSGSKRMYGNVPIPRYVQLADLMRRRIAQGEWLPGDTLPSIENLMREFDVARVTIRQAIGLLADEGLVSPQRGRGTFVTDAAGRKKKLVVESTLDQLVDMYQGDKPDLSNVVESDLQPELSEQDGVPAPHYFHMRRVHSRDGEKYCVVSIFLDDRVFQLAPSRFRKEVVLPVLAELPAITITSARQTLAISAAGPDVAQDLEITVNAPIAEVRRVLCGPDGSVIYVGEATYRGDYIRLEMDLKP
jgi:GntR family transcriptional regulator